MKLIVNACHGRMYEAEAWLEDAQGLRTFSGSASLGSRRGFEEAKSGTYRFESVNRFPNDARVKAEFGSVGAIFRSVASAEPLLVHSGDASLAHRPTYGTLRLSPTLFTRLRLEFLTASSSELMLEVRITEKPSFWSTMTRPRTVKRLREDGLNLFEDTYPELGSFPIPNATHAWMYFWGNSEGSQSGGGGDFAGGGASGSWDEEKQAEHRAPVNAKATLEESPVFAATGFAHADDNSRGHSEAQPADRCSATGDAQETDSCYNSSYSSSARESDSNTFSASDSQDSSSSTTSSD